jgi:topoisomerase IA-like protein
VLNGRYGIYIQAPKGNYRIPKTKNVNTLTESEVKEIIATTEPMSAAKRYSRKK